MSKTPLTGPQQEWIDALRSGDYEQGRIAMRSAANRYCCLGVACDVSEVGVWHQPTDEDDCGFRGDHYYKTAPHPSDNDNNSRVVGYGYALPPLVKERLGLAMGLEGSLSYLNDNHVPFSVIADFLETEGFDKNPSTATLDAIVAGYRNKATV